MDRLPRAIAVPMRMPQGVPGCLTSSDRPARTSHWPSEDLAQPGAALRPEQEVRRPSDGPTASRAGPARRAARRNPTTARCRRPSTPPASSHTRWTRPPPTAPVQPPSGWPTLRCAGEPLPDRLAGDDVSRPPPTPERRAAPQARPAGTFSGPAPDPDAAGRRAVRDRADRRARPEVAAEKAPRYFRPDIEGLRAVAVIAVLLFHVGLPRTDRRLRRCRRLLRHLRFPDHGSAAARRGGEGQASICCAFYARRMRRLLAGGAGRHRGHAGDCRR